MSSYEKIADLPLTVESYELEGLELNVGAFDRLTTLIKINGGGEQGVGEDVVYDGLDHIALRDAGPVLDLAGSYTFDEFSKKLDELPLFPEPPEREVSENYRRWAFESAALDLALRQAGKPLHEVLEREPKPVNFVCSMRLAPFDREQGQTEPSSIEPLKARLEHYPDLRFKLDPTNDWTDELIGAAGRDRRGRLARPQGPVQGHPGRRRHRP